jgi:hypothetical protein
MNNPYDLHSWSTQYRQERMRDAQTTHLEGRLRKDRKTRSERGSVSLALASVLTLMRGA